MGLRPAIQRRGNSVFKSIHFGKRFRMYAFRVKNGVYMWRPGVNVKESFIVKIIPVSLSLFLSAFPSFPLQP